MFNCDYSHGCLWLFAWLIAVLCSKFNDAFKSSVLCGDAPINRPEIGLSHFMTRSVLTALGRSHEPIAIWWRQRVRTYMMRGDINDLAQQSYHRRCGNAMTFQETLKNSLCCVCFAWCYDEWTSVMLELVCASLRRVTAPRNSSWSCPL